MPAGGGAPVYRTSAPGARRRLSRFSLLLAANLFIVSLVLVWIPFFEAQELRTQDLRLHLRGERPVHPDLVVIHINKRTIRKYNNSWPLPRDQYALLIAALQDWGARVVAIDLWFSGRDRYSDRNDTTLAVVTGQSPSVIDAVYLSLSLPTSASHAAGREASRDDSLYGRFFEPIPRGATLMTASAERGDIDLPPILLEEVHALGHIGLVWGADNVSRYAPLLIEYEGRAVPALSLLMACRYLGSDWRSARVEPGGLFRASQLVLETPRGPLRIPVDRYCRALINFPGDQKAFPRQYEFIDVMQSAREWADRRKPAQTWPQPEEFRGKIVLVCNTAPDLTIADVGPTPFSDSFPLAFAHAGVVNSILRRDYLQYAPRGFEVIGLAALAVGLGLLLPILAPATLGLVSLAVLVALFGIAWTLLVFGGIQMSLVPPFFLVMSLSVGILLRGYVVRERERRAVEHELEVARRVQQDLLPKGPLVAGQVQVSGTNLPCFAVGGDYFDYFTMGDGRLAIAIGDVAGKGVSAALLMSKLQAILRGETSHAASVSEVPERANRLLMEAMKGSSKFVTFFFSVLDPRSRELRYSNAGHNPPLLLRADGTVLPLTEGGLLLGIFSHAQYEEAVIELEPGDVLVLFTDGVTEAEDRRKAQYGEDRLVHVLRESRGESAREIGDRICQEVLKFSKGLQMADDLTVVVVKVEGTGMGVESDTRVVPGLSDNGTSAVA